MIERIGSGLFGRMSPAFNRQREARFLTELPTFDAKVLEPAESRARTPGQDTGRDAESLTRPEALLALWDGQHLSASGAEKTGHRASEQAQADPPSCDPSALESMALLLGQLCYVRTPSTGRVRYAPHSLGELLGLNELITPFQGHHWDAQLHAGDRTRCEFYCQSLLAEPGSVSSAPGSLGRVAIECRLRDHQDHWRWFRFKERVTARDATGKASQVLGTIEETTEQHQLEQRLYQASFFDRLTGLPNRELLLHRLEQQLDQTMDHSVALVLIDIDDFRVINSRFGHGTGDRLLQLLGQRLKRVLRPSDWLSRWDNDVLAVVLSPLTSSEEADEWIQHLRQQLREPFKIGPRSLFVSAGIGMASSLQIDPAGPFSGGRSIHPQPSPSSLRSSPLAEQLMQYAEEALGSAKKYGKGGCCGFSPQQHEQNVQQFALEALLRRAIANQMLPFSGTRGSQLASGSARQGQAEGIGLQGHPGESSALPRHGRLQLYYQPIVDLQTGKLEGFEALIRWQLPGRDLLSPKEFIPLAEETGLIVPLGQWVLHQACAQLSHWQQLWPSAQNLTMSVNLSPRQLLQHNLLWQIDHILQETGLCPQQLRLELTETVMMENLAQSRSLLEALRQRNISLSIDDFGTGYSSLSYLDRLPLNTLKIDRSFVQRMGKQGECGEIVRAIVAMAQSLNLETVVEGISTRQQVNYLRSLGCNKAQGSYFAMPLPAHRAIQWIAQAA